MIMAEKKVVKKEKVKKAVKPKEEKVEKVKTVEEKPKVKRVKEIDPWQTLRWVKLTEKALSNVERENKLVFVVRSGATREEIKKAVEAAFDVKVAKVNMLIDTRGEKKAFVKLKKEFSALDVATKLGMM